jgi:dihydroorotate dehydrogenase
MYGLLRGILFLFPPEWTHYFSMNNLRFLCSISFIRKSLAGVFNSNKMLHDQYSIFNIQFKNRVGLGAGFDKNAKYLRELQTLGFGFVEIGTVTPLPQDGNPKPRLFRLPKDKALINRMGFNNDGVKVVAGRLKEWKNKQLAIGNRQLAIGNRQLATADSHDSRLTSHDSRLIIGGNIGKNKITPNEDAWKDYEICFKELFDYVDYFVVNVSSPNTPGLRELQEKESLRKILTNLQQVRVSLWQAQGDSYHPYKPILLKIAPDLTTEQIDDVIDLALEIKLDGIVATNTTISRSALTTHRPSLSLLRTSASRLTNIGNGGLSGKPLQEKSTSLVKYIHEKTNGKIPIIASGGIFNAADAKEKFQAGASLLQVWTGFIYEGPAIVKKIYRNL